MLTKVIKIHSHKTKKFMTKNKLVRSNQEQKIDDNSNGQLSSILKKKGCLAKHLPGIIFRCYLRQPSGDDSPESSMATDGGWVETERTSGPLLDSSIVREVG